MTSRFTELAIDCADPQALAGFWCAVLGYEVLDDEEEGVVTIGAPASADEQRRPGPVAPVMTFARVPEGKVGKNRLHLDLNPSDQDQEAEVRRVLELGARHADIGQTGDEPWVCLADPEGNEFCILASRHP